MPRFDLRGDCPLARKVSREALVKHAVALARKGPLHVSVAAYRWRVSESSARGVLRIAAHISNGQLIYERGVLKACRGYVHRAIEPGFHTLYDIRSKRKSASPLRR